MCKLVHELHGAHDEVVDYHQHLAGGNGVDVLQARCAISIRRNECCGCGGRRSTMRCESVVWIRRCERSGRSSSNQNSRIALLFVLPVSVIVSANVSLRETQAPTVSAAMFTGFCLPVSAVSSVSFSAFHTEKMIATAYILEHIAYMVL